MTEVKRSLKIATANLKNFNVIVESDGGDETLRLCDFFLSLVERGVQVQVVVYEAFRLLPVHKGKLPSTFGKSTFRVTLQ